MMSLDGSQRDRNFNNYATLAILFIVSVLFCSVFDHETLYTKQVLAVFDFYYCT